jgi:TPR repeat protein
LAPTNINYQVNLALSLAAGKGCTKNETAAAKWFEKAAEMGDVRAARMIGTAHRFPHYFKG